MDKTPTDLKRCQRLDDSPYIFPGWGCCECQTYNGYQRITCSYCGHEPCYFHKPYELLPYVSRDINGNIVTGFTPPPPSSRTT